MWSLAHQVSKNGNLLLDVGPMANGTIPPLQRARLEALGRWNAVNGAAVFDSEPLFSASCCALTHQKHEVRFTRRADGEGWHVFALVWGQPSQYSLGHPAGGAGAGAGFAMLLCSNPLVTLHKGAERKGDGALLMREGEEMPVTWCAALPFLIAPRTVCDAAAPEPPAPCVPHDRKRLLAESCFCGAAARRDLIHVGGTWDGSQQNIPETLLGKGSAVHGIIARIQEITGRC
jgi:hypothetical protein